MPDILIPGAVGELEAHAWSTLDGRPPRAAIVFCHPHPLYGGSMKSNVVFRAARGLQEAGVAVLRFNFRGVGRSNGVHHGAGGEVDDLGAALGWMAAAHPGVELWAGGFSFGSRTAAQRAIVDERIRRIVLVALPVRAFDCSYILDVRQPGLVLMAGNDEFGTLRELREKFGALDPGLETDEIPGTDHFFGNETQELQRRVRTYAERVLGVTT